MLEELRKKMEYELLKSMIVRHPTFSCPKSGAMLDVRDAIAVEVEWQDGRTKFLGPWSISGCDGKGIAGGDIVQHCRNVRALLLNRDVQLPLFDAPEDTPPIEHPKNVTIYNGRELKRFA